MDSLMKKTRCPFKDLDCEFYGESYEIGKTEFDKYDEEVYEFPITHLNFFEFFSKSNPDLLHMLSMMEYVHGLAYEENENENEGDKEAENESEKSKEDEKTPPYSSYSSSSPSFSPSIEYPVHPYIRAVHSMGRVYVALDMAFMTLFRPKSLSHVYAFVQKSKKSLNDIHGLKLYISNITPTLFLWNEKDIDTLAFSADLLHNLKRTSLVSKKSIIIGTQCISPYQVLWDMMHSKYERDEIEYPEFKRKLKVFWESIMKADFALVPGLCQTIYGKKTGLNYLDFVINKWCDVKQINGKAHVIKSTRKILPTENLYMIDWFCLGIQIVRYLEILRNEARNGTVLPREDKFEGYPKELDALVFKCITMEVNDEDRRL